MSCTKCNYQFCWLCLGRYSTVHYAWWNMLGCPKQQYSHAYWRGWKYVFIVFFIPLLVLALAAALVAAVAFALVGGLALPAAVIRRRVSSLRGGKKIAVWVGLQILAAALFPVIFVLMLVPGSCIAGYSYLRRML
jgi:hypothetical protein